MKQVSTLVVAAVLIVTSGVLHAIQTNAWTREEALSESARRVDSLPLVAGPWEGSRLEFDPDQLKAAQAAGAISRTYRRDAENELNVMLLCGPSGPISVHPPTVCFVSAGYRQVTEQRRFEVLSQKGQPIGSFWVADFEWQERDGRSSRIRTYWGWSNDGHWQSPEYPRYEFAGSKVLFKLYVTQRITGSKADPESAEEFLRDFLPIANATLFATDDKLGA